MLGRTFALLVLAAGFLSSNGCCGLCDRWCNNQPRCYQPAPCTCAAAPPPAQVCQPCNPPPATTPPPVPAYRPPGP